MSAIHCLALNVSRISSFLRGIVGCLTAFARALFLPRALAHVVWRTRGEVRANMLAILEAKFDYLFKLVSSTGLGCHFRTNVGEMVKRFLSHPVGVHLKYRTLDRRLVAGSQRQR